MDFRAAADSCARVDALILRAIRDHHYLSFDEINEEYRALVAQQFSDSGRTIDSFLRQLQETTDQQRLLSTLPKPTLKIRVEKDFRSVSFFTEDSALRLSVPKLLWDCVCKTPEPPEWTANATARLSPACPIHGHPLGALVDKLFASGLVAIRYGSIEVLYRDMAEFWPPAIDSFHLVDTLRKQRVFDEPYSSVLDIGCGTGFLGIVTACECRNLCLVTMADWLLTPILFSVVNWARNSAVRPGISLRLRLGLNSNWITDDRASLPHDLVLCNPPYLPLPDEFRKIGLSSTVAGTELLQHVIQESPRLGKAVYVSFSELAQVEAGQAAKVAGRKLVRLGEPLHSPFRVTHVFDNREYLRFLIEERGLQVRMDSPHRLWHKVSVYKVE
ncbi:MAG: methyltransferase [Acidobacteria bacterium]|nr:methyltransferase [Acidobacteriota bacterium]MCL5287617.1 methyltransferase [Acidobacteriota bacterium]